MEVIAVLVNSKAIARACVVFELEQVRDGQSQLLAVPRNPVLTHFLLVEGFGTIHIYIYIYIYIHVYTYGGIYMHVRWGWGLESGKL